MKRNFGCLILLLGSVLGLPEQGIWQLSFNKKNNYHAVYKSMYQGTKVALKVECLSKKDVQLDIGWLLRYTPCAEEYIGLESNDRAAEVYYSKPDTQMIDVFKYDTFEYMLFETTQICSNVPIVLPDLTKKKPTIVTKKLNSTGEVEKPKSATGGTSEKSKVKTEAPKPTTVATTAKPSKKSKRAAPIQKAVHAVNGTTPLPGKSGDKIDHHYVAQTWRDGYFLFVLKVQPEDADKDFDVQMRGAVVFAELVSCLKRMLARMLVIIVSLGFGIVKPRLGPAFHKVLCVGGVYFILGSIEGCMRALKDDDLKWVEENIPTSVTDKALPSLLDSDEEMMTTKYEMSKMQ
ncbi:hypothetical protein KUTeg_014141 [Tegillarca granosa]|uniref:Uncharacterized protein n=1 Tax=Tegillarca granosa TaxID=220873 RepID=A0ABQ9F063_TEGGR|nr:hypothetical protein KUTeg_014141 [Tegillarca granosa]